MLIAIPSKGRPSRGGSIKILPSATVYVPESEVTAYHNSGYTKLVGIPDTVTGITKTRNWILDNTNERRVVMVDDDCNHAGWRKLYSHHTKDCKITEQGWLTEFAKLFDVTEGLHYRIWGVATHSAARAIYPFRPFLWHAYITASCMGIVNDGRARFDEAFPVKEDYELCLRCIKEDGGVVAARFLYWENEHWGTDGGCGAYRTNEMEQDCIRRLKMLYGKKLILQVERGGSEWSVELRFLSVRKRRRT